MNDICPHCLSALHPEFKDGRCPVVRTGIALRKGTKIAYADIDELRVSFVPPIVVPRDGGYVLKLDPPRLEQVWPQDRATGA